MSNLLSMKLALSSWACVFLAITALMGLISYLSLCGPHAINNFFLVLIFYRSTIFPHLRTSITDALSQTTAVHVLNMVVARVLNPLIYTLYDKEVRERLLRKLKGKYSSTTQWTPRHALHHLLRGCQDNFQGPEEAF
ncbi:Olfactory receptor 6F1 [Heterocephalus glaber]|uniref:Olfactory receptor 6F1 n=1 Tax=Heterocephalus glaber TaxID=10181 RepID=G5BKQ3_HETGA|nr:Olfactory receptor 6F1 [Heterocephalus glaber]